MESVLYLSFCKFFFRWVIGGVGIMQIKKIYIDDNVVTPVFDSSFCFNLCAVDIVISSPPASSDCFI